MSASNKARPGWGAAGPFLVFAGVLCAYWPSLWGGFVWDDDAHVTKAALRSLGGLGRIWFELGATQQYYPVLHSAFWVEHRLWGDSPFGYHLLNVLLHATAACLFARVLRRLWEGRWPGAEWLGALLFALHPVCVESVAWISEQKNTLSIAFYLGAALAYLRFSLAFEPPADRREAAVAGSAKGGGRRVAGEGRGPGAKSAYALASALFVLAVLTKSVTATLPAALLAALWWRRGRVPGRDWGFLAPWLLFGGLFGLFTAWVERRYIGAQGPEFALDYVQRCVLAGRAFWFYLGKVVAPAGFMFVYPRWKIDAGVWWQVLCPIAAVGVFAAIWLVSRRIARFRGLVAAGLIFGGTLFPALGFLNVYPFIFSFVADHFQYAASLAIFGLAAGCAGELWSRLSGRARGLFAPAIAMGLVALGISTRGLCFDYRDSETLYRATLARNPDAWLASLNLGSVLMAKGDDAAAESNFRSAERLAPGYQALHFDLGRLLMREGRLSEAIVEFQEALRLNPNDAEARDNLGVSLAQTGRVDEARGQFEAAVRLEPGNPTARYNLGVALQGEGRLGEAAQSFAEAVRLRPDYPEARSALDRLGYAPSSGGAREPRGAGSEPARR